MPESAAVLLDLDGTVYHSDRALPGGVEFVARLLRENRPFACISNGTSSPARLSDRLGRMGVNVDPAHIHTAGGAAADYVLERFGPRPRVYNLCSTGVHDLLDGCVQWVDDGDEACDAIIIGAIPHRYATEQRLRTALLLARNGALLVGTSADRIWPSRRGLEFGAGAVTQLLAYAANTEPVFVGKPQPIFFQSACRHLGVPPERCILIGDNLEADIAGGKALGMGTILTLSGVTRPEDVRDLPGRQCADAIIPDLTALLSE